MALVDANAVLSGGALLASSSWRLVTVRGCATPTPIETIEAVPEFVNTGSGSGKTAASILPRLRRFGEGRRYAFLDSRRSHSLYRCADIDCNEPMTCVGVHYGGKAGVEAGVVWVHS